MSEGKPMDAADRPDPIHGPDEDCGNPGCVGFHEKIRWMTDEHFEAAKKAAVEHFMPGEEGYATVAEPIPSLVNQGRQSVNGMLMWADETLHQMYTGILLIEAGEKEMGWEIVRRTLRSSIIDHAFVHAIATTIAQTAAENNVHPADFQVGLAEMPHAPDDLSGL